MGKTVYYQVGYNPLLWSIGRLTKSIYNVANHIIREEIFPTEKRVPDVDELENKILQTSMRDGYKSLPRDTGRLVLEILIKKWQKYKRSLEEWEKYHLSEKPEPPFYRKRSGVYLIPFKGGQLKQSGGFLEFPLLGSFPIPQAGSMKIRSAAFIPSWSGFRLRIDYEA